MSISAAQMLAALRTRTPDMLALTKRLVNIDSGSYYKQGVNEVADLMATKLALVGFDVARKPLADRGDQLTATKKLGGKGRLLVIGHLDTVWPEGTVADWPFAISGDIASGPGVGDMKSAIVMAAFAMEMLLDGGFDGLESIRYILVPDEELGSVQSRAWIEEEGRNADWALTLEPSRPGGGLVTARGAVGALFLDAAGRSAHSAVSYAKGASAVRELAAMVGKLEALSRPDEGMIVNVGVFQGGAARQVVPHEAKIHIDLRARTAEQSDHLLSEIKRIAGDTVNPAVTVTLSGGLTRPVFPRSEGTAALYQSAQAIAGELNIPVFEVASPGGSDGSFPAALGVPTIDGLGPVCHDTCSRQETIEIASIAERGALFAGIIAGLGTAAKGA